MIWFTSDTHYGQVNIAGKSVSSWESGYRDFNSLHQMNECLINTINKYVAPEDTLYHLGDWSFGNQQNVEIFRNSLVCENIILILGNHDKHISKEKHGHLFVNIVDTFYLVLNKEDRIFMSHYPHRVWKDSHKGSIHLYGHNHNTIEDWGKSTDVGVDVAYSKFGEYRPFSLDEILKMMKNKKVLHLGSH